MLGRITHRIRTMQLLADPYLERVETKLFPSAVGEIGEDRIRFLNRSWWKHAAAAIIVLSLGVYL